MYQSAHLANHLLIEPSSFSSPSIQPPAPTQHHHIRSDTVQGIISMHSVCNVACGFVASTVEQGLLFHRKYTSPSLVILTDFLRG